jgi:hypothetical protein
VTRYPATPTFWLERTDTVAVGLRRYHRGGEDAWTCEAGYHSALMFTGEAPAIWRPDEHSGRHLDAQPGTPRDDPRWPAACRCGYAFTADDEWQDWQELLYLRTDTAELVSLRTRQESDVDGPPSAPPGATWDAWWLPDAWRGPDGIAYAVRCPNGQVWHVDGRAANCTLPDDRVHKCWVRHGDPRECHVTVDKTGGPTCAAGAGSIQAGDYHGFLRDGVLTAA